MKSKAILTVIGQDRVGIVYGISKELADNDVNIEDISQTIIQDYFTMIMLVTIDESQVSIGILQKRLEAIGDELGVKITIQQEDIFRFMHRI